MSSGTVLAAAIVCGSDQFINDLGNIKRFVTIGKGAI